MALALLLLSPNEPVSAQDARSRSHGHGMWTKGLTQEQNDDKEGALRSYAGVNRNDTVFERALLRRVNILLQTDRSAEALPLCDEGIEIDGDHTALFHMTKGAALVELDKHQEALDALNGAIATYPGNFRLRHLRALAFQEMGRNEDALRAFQENVVRFPMQQEAHMSLAVLAQREGRTSQAALSALMAMVMGWGSDRSERILIYADELLAGKLEDEPKGIDITKGDDFAELDLLLANQVAMNKKYQVEPDLPYPIVRQGHLLLSSLKDVPEGDGFWNRYYVPFFKRLMSDGHFEAFMYHCMSNSRDEKVKSLVGKKMKDVQEFRRALFPIVNEQYATFPDTMAGITRPLHHSWNDDNDLNAYGDGDATKDEQTGQWIFFHPNGALSARGSFDAAHKKDGQWFNYYDNGHLQRESYWKSGEQNGMYKSWYGSGVPLDSVNVVADKAEGLFTLRAPSGRIRSRRVFVADEATGPATYYYACDAREFSAQLTNDKANGELIGYYPDGTKKWSGTFQDNQRHGMVEDFHPNAQMRSRGTYEMGDRNGAFVEWYPNGTKKEEASYLKGHFSGKRTTWYAHGGMDAEELYDEQGRETGVHKQYREEGSLYNEFEYNKGLLVRYRYFDTTGKVIGEGKRSSGRFNFVGFTLEGNKRMEGSYLDEGAKDGTWKWYWPDGTLRSEETLKAGAWNGTKRDHTRNGKLQTEYRYLPGKSDTGPYTEYFQDGKIASQGYVEDGSRNGELRHFDPDGTVLDELYFVDGEQQGWQRYYDSDGVVRLEELMASGFLRELVEYDATGKEYERVKIQPGAFVMELHLPDGKLDVRINYRNGVKHGIATWFYPDGSKESEGSYFEGEQDGVWAAWYPNGQKSWERTYAMGADKGVRKSWYMDGTLELEESYEHGYSTGYKSYHQNGKLSIDRPHVVSEDHGAIKSYGPAGDLQLVRYFSHARLYGYSYATADGKLVDTIPLPEGSQKLRPLYANGKPSREMDYRNGEIDGSYREFHPNGKVLEEAVYAGGQRNGVNKEYTAEGVVLAESNWLHDERHGMQTTYWTNGKPQEKAQWTYGELHGDRILHDKTGKPTLIITYRHGNAVGMRRP